MTAAAVTTPVAYSEGLAVTVAGVGTHPIKNTLKLTRSLADGASLGFSVTGLRANLTHVQRSALVTVVDVLSDTTLFSGHILRARVFGAGGTGTVITIRVKVAGRAQRLYRRILTGANARAVNTAANAETQLDELVSIAGPNYSAGSVHANVNALSGIGSGTSVGLLLRGMGDAQRVKPDGEIDLLMRAGLASAATVDRDHIERRHSSYNVDLDTEVGRVLAIGADVKFIATGTLENVTEAGVTLAVATVSTPDNTEVDSIDRVFARATIAGAFDETDRLFGVWDPDDNRFEWSGTLGAGESALVELHGVWHTEIVVSSASASALAGDLVLQVPVTGADAIQAAADTALARQRQPIELMTLTTILGNALPRMEPGDAVKISLALQQDLDVHQPVETDLWIVHGIGLTQPASAQAAVVLRLSRRLPDYRNRDFWSQGDSVGNGGRQIVIGDGGGAPQIAQVIPTQTVVVGGDAVTVDLADYFSDPDDDTLAYEAESSDESKATVAIAGSTLTITPVAAGSISVTVTASDATLSTAQIVGVSVILNRSPTIDTTISSQTIVFETILNLSDYFSDPDGDDLGYTVTSDAPDRVSVTVAGSLLTLSGEDEGGAATITVEVSDGFLSVTQGFTATATPRLGPILIGDATTSSRPSTPPHRTDRLITIWSINPAVLMAPAGESLLVEDVTKAAYLRSLTITENRHSQLNRVSINTPVKPYGLAPFQVSDRVDLIEAWENNSDGSIVYQLAGIDYPISGPNAPPYDDNELYAWPPTAADAATIGSFRTAYFDATQAERDAITVRFVAGT